MNCKSRWDALGDIPVNDDGEIQEPFEDFPVGTNFEKTMLRYGDADLDTLLDEISVMEIEDEEVHPDQLIGWYGVVSDLGIIAYFPEENEALKYRLDYINRIMNFKYRLDYINRMLNC